MNRLIWIVLLLSACGVWGDADAAQEILYVRDNAACTFNGNGSTPNCAASNGAAGAFNGWFQVAFNATDETPNAVDPGDLVYICGAHTGGYFHGPTDASGLGSGTSGNVVTVSFDCPGNPGSVTSDSATTVYGFGSYAKFLRIVNPVVTGGRETISISDSLADQTAVMNVTIVGGSSKNNTYANTNSKCVSLRGRNIVVDGLTVDNCWNDGIWGIGKNNEVKNTRVSNVSVGPANLNGDCVQWSGEVDGVWMHDNYCDHRTVDAKYCYISSGPSDNGFVRITNNVCVRNSTDTVGDGILIQSSPGLIASNKITGGFFGARCQPDAAEQCDMIGNLLLFQNNTGLGNGGLTTLGRYNNNTIIGTGAQTGIEMQTNQAGTEARNNIFVNVGIGIKKFLAGNAPIDTHNLFYQVSGNPLTVNGTPTSTGTGSLLSIDPQFVGSLYSTKSTSPARRAGIFYHGCIDVRGRICNSPPDIGGLQASPGDMALGRLVRN